MSHQYQVRLYNTSGAQVAVFDDWNSLYFYNRVSDFGYHTFSIAGDDDRVSLFTPDSIIEVLRRDEGIPWYREYLAFHRTGVYQVTDRGRELFSSYGRGFEDLLHRREVLWRPGTLTVGSFPYGAAADDSMKVLVRYNAGLNATLAAGRIANGETPGLTVAADISAAPAWHGERSYKNLLDVLIEIKEAKSVDFGMTWLGGQSTLFTTYYPRKGTDRTGAGSAAPVVFALEHGNMSQPYLTESRTEEITAVYVLGQGEGADRVIVERINTSEIIASPWNRIEFAHDARNEATIAGLNQIGDGHLMEHGFDRHLSFQIVASPSTVYGREYFLGDLVLGRFKGVTQSLKIIGMEVTVADGKENLRIHFGGK
jgi:hypothetical protein